MSKQVLRNALISIIAFLSFNTYAEFKSSSEASSIITGGNTELKTYLVKTENKWTKEKNIFSINGNYTYGESSNVTSAERWAIGIRYDRVLSKQIDAFIGELVESNRFAGFSRRYNTDAGLKAKLLKNEKTEAFVEAGFRYTVEKKKDPNIKDDKDSKGRGYFEIKRVINESVNGRFWIEYVPNFTTSKDYLINLEPSLSVAMNNVFSLKFAFLWNYDNLPAPGNGKHDYAYTTGVIANF
jgi:putative salt-induced outer membrane protein